MSAGSLTFAKQPLDAAHDVAMRARGWPEETPLPEVYMSRENPPGIVVLMGREPAGLGLTDPRWHLSVRAEGRVPTWEELVETAHKLRPGVCFVVGVPPRSWWMNVHPDVLHLWEVRDENLTEMWRAEAQGHVPT